MPRINWKLLIAVVFIFLIIVTILGIIINKYSTTTEPILYISAPRNPNYYCDINDIPIGKDHEFKINLQNMGETPAFSAVCFYADKVTFKDINKNVFQNQICDEQEHKLSPKSEDVVYIYKPIIFINENNAPDTITIRIEASCSYRILSLIRKKCYSLTHLCNYKKENDYYKYAE